MNTEHLHFLLEVIKCGSINKASKKININNQHLGRIITSIEDEIGVKLLKRDRIGVSLTPQGEEIIKIIENIDMQTTQLKYYFQPNNTTLTEKPLNIFCPATINQNFINNFIFSLKSFLPDLSIHIKEVPNDKIINKISESADLAFAALYSFLDFPSLCIEESLFPKNLQILSTKKAKLAMISTANNLMSYNYSSISIESLVHKPLVIYSPYEIKDNLFYQLLSLYGQPFVKYTATNLQTFYELINNTDCVSIGANTNSYKEMFNYTFSDQQLKYIPIRENIEIKILYVTNNKYYNSIMKDIIAKCVSSI